MGYFKLRWVLDRFLVPTCFHFRAKIPIKSNKIPIPRGIKVLIDFWVDICSDFRRQDEPKTGPRGRQDRQDGPKRPPRRPQEAAKTAPRGSQKTDPPRSCCVLAAKRPQDAPKTAQEASKTSSKRDPKKSLISFGF